MKAIIAGDHYTVDLLKIIEEYLASKGIQFQNVGTMDSNQKISLQEIIPPVAETVRKGEAEIGILVCGTGAGVEIGANRFRGIRASLCVSAKQAEYARVYDNANILALSSWLTDDPTAILDAWFGNKFDGNEARSNMLKAFDVWE